MKKIIALNLVISLFFISGCSTFHQSDYNGVGQCRNGSVNCGSC